MKCYDQYKKMCSCDLFHNKTSNIKHGYIYIAMSTYVIMHHVVNKSTSDFYLKTFLCRDLRFNRIQDIPRNSFVGLHRLHTM